MAVEVCVETGLTKPECACRDCVRELVERFAPHGESSEPGPSQPTCAGYHFAMPSVHELGAR